MKLLKREPSDTINWVNFRRVNTMKKTTNEFINKAINGTKDIAIKCGKLMLPMVCTAVCNYVCKNTIDGYNVNLKVDKATTNDFYIPGVATFSDAVRAITNSTMTSYDKQNTISCISRDGDTDYYKSIMYIVKGTSTSYDKYCAINRL